MKVWGITGLIGTGKTEAVNYLAELGFPCVNMEQISKTLVDKNTDIGREGFTRIYKIFGGDVLNSLGQLDAGKLAQKLLLNPHDRKLIEEAIDPLLNDVIEKKRVEWMKDEVELAFIEGARIYDSGMDKNLSGVITIEADVNKRVKRVAKRDHMGETEVKLMFQYQDNTLMSRLATKKWDNNKTKPALFKQIDTFLGDYVELVDED